MSERLMADGTWSLKFREGTPYSIRGLFAAGDQIFITPVTVPVSMQTFTTLKSTARYTGVVTRRENHSVSGRGLLAWLGNSTIGAILNPTGWSDNTNDFKDWVRDIMSYAGVIDVPNCPYTEGTVYDFDATTTELRVGGQLRRPFLDRIMAIYEGMYKVLPDNTFHAGRQEDLFLTTPTTVAMPKGGVRDLNVTGLKAMEINLSYDAGDFQTGWYVVGSGEGLTATYSQSNFAAWADDLLGNDLVLQKLISAPDAVNTAEAAAAGLGEWVDDLRKVGTVTLSTDTHDIRRHVTPGDNVWVYDPDQMNLFDTSNPVRHAGRIVYPATRICQAITWPLEEGMGVYRRHYGTGAITDLTSYIEWEVRKGEEAKVSFELGGIKRRNVPQVDNPATERRLR